MQTLTVMDTFLHEVIPPKDSNTGSTNFMLEDLARSGLVPEDMKAYPIAKQGFAQIPAYVIPFTHNKHMWTTRYDRKESKYIGPKGVSDIWLPPQLTLEQLKAAQVIYMIEGEKKAAKFYKQFKLPTIGIRGCWGFNTRAYSEDGAALLHPTLVNILTVGKTIKVVFDADILTKIDIQQAALRLTKLTKGLFVEVEIYKPPHEKGVDDWLVANPAGTVADLELVPAISIQDTWNQIYKETECLMRTVGGLPVGPKANESNASKILAYIYAGQLSKDAYHGFIFKGKPLNDAEHLRNKILTYLQAETHADWTPRHIDIALSMVLKDTESNILADYIKGLVWDGVPRLNTWASEYIETATPSYTNEWGRLLITSMILRVLKPGSRVDYMYTISGLQGIGKTTFFQELANIDRYSYYNQMQHVSRGTNSDTMTEELIFKSSVLMDLDEGVYQKKADADEVKSLITRPHGMIRDLYSKTLIKYPRGCVFVSTGNKTTTLKDVTGARRFVIITASKIIKLPEDIKYQLFAEVVAKEKAIRDSNWFDIVCEDETDTNLTAFEKTLSVQERHNLRYTQMDPIADFIAELADSGVSLAKKVKTGEMFINTSFLQFKLKNSSIPLGMQTYAYHRLAELANSPNFPFKIEPAKTTPKQLEFPADQVGLYFNGASAAEVTKITGCRGFWITRK